MDKKTLTDRISAYLIEADRNNIEYLLGDTGIFVIMGGNPGKHKGSVYGDEREKIGYFSGKFQDAVEYAVQHPKFYGGWFIKNSVKKKDGYILKLEGPDLEKIDYSKLLTKKSSLLF